MYGISTIMFAILITEFCRYIYHTWSIGGIDSVLPESSPCIFSPRSRQSRPLGQVLPEERAAGGRDFNHGGARAGGTAGTEPC